MYKFLRLVRIPVRSVDCWFGYDGYSVGFFSWEADDLKNRSVFSKKGCNQCNMDEGKD